MRCPAGGPTASARAGPAAVTTMGVPLNVARNLGLRTTLCNIRGGLPSGRVVRAGAYQSDISVHWGASGRQHDPFVLRPAEDHAAAVVLHRRRRAGDPVAVRAGRDSAVPVKYEAKAQILVLPPRPRSAPAVTPTSRSAACRLQPTCWPGRCRTAQTFQQLRGAGLTGTYTVARDLTTSGPVLLVAATELDSCLGPAAPCTGSCRRQLPGSPNCRTTSACRRAPG